MATFTFLDDLRPSTLARICAILTEEAADHATTARDVYQRGHPKPALSEANACARIKKAAQQYEAALYRNVGEEDGMLALLQAGVFVSVLAGDDQADQRAPFVETESQTTPWDKEK